MFTLAESLIVMGIIGVVAALTLPNLNSSTGNKEKVAKVKKIYSNLNDAFGRAVAVYGPFEEWFINDGNDNNKKIKRAGERISEFMKISKICGVNSKNCFTNGKPNNYIYYDYFLGGSTPDDLGLFDEIAGNGYSFILSDGTCVNINFDCFFTNCLGAIQIDIDGMNNGKFSVNEDVFYFGISNNGVTTNFRSDEAHYDCVSIGSCTGWVVEYDNMDYLKCFDKLTDNKTSCK